MGCLALFLFLRNLGYIAECIYSLWCLVSFSRSSTTLLVLPDKFLGIFFLSAAIYRKLYRELRRLRSTGEPSRISSAERPIPRQISQGGLLSRSRFIIIMDASP